jgi:cold shock CspA family protein
MLEYPGDWAEKCHFHTTFVAVGEEGERALHTVFRGPHEAKGRYYLKDTHLIKDDIEKGFERVSKLTQVRTRKRSWDPPMPPVTMMTPINGRIRMVTLPSRVKWFHKEGGYGAAVPLEFHNHLEVFLPPRIVRAAGFVVLQKKMVVIVTFDASDPKPKALDIKLP